MFKLSIKNKFGQEFSNTGTVEELNIWKQKCIAENCWGKYARQEIKKGQPLSEDYDDADVLSEEEKETSAPYERAKYSKTETVLTSYTDMDGITQSGLQPRYIGQEVVPAKFITMVNLKSEYELSEIIDLSKDPEYIKQMDEVESQYNVDKGTHIIIRIGGMNLKKARENTFDITMAAYFQMFELPCSLLEKGALESAYGVLQALPSEIPYSKEEMEEIKGWILTAIQGRPTR